jgi:hypothetical protein
MEGAVMGSISKSVSSFTGRLIGNATGASQAADAASHAADVQGAAAQSGIDEQRRQFDLVQQLMSPFVGAGTKALSQQGDLAGLNGDGSMQAAIDAIQRSPQYTSMLKAGENSLMANASATGGLRGGNLQSAMAQFSPALLSQLINDQYSRLGGLTSLGQNAAAMTGNAGMSTGNNVSNLLQQQGAATAGGILAQGNVTRQAFNDVLSLASAGGSAAKAGAF